MTKLADLDHCPKCSGTTGLYTLYMTGFMDMYKFGEEEPGDSEGTNSFRGGGVFYCRDFQRPVIGTDGKLR